MITFTITEEHIKLLSSMYVRWWDAEFGAPCIDPKRPYGNGDVIDDIAEIIGEEPDCVHEGVRLYSDEQDERLEKLHKEMETVLQIVLVTKSFETGDYALKESWSTHWFKK